MISFYIRMVNSGRITLEQVPERWRSEVEALVSNSVSETVKMEAPTTN